MVKGHPFHGTFSTSVSTNGRKQITFFAKHISMYVLVHSVSTTSLALNLSDELYVLSDYPFSTSGKGFKGKPG